MPAVALAAIRLKRPMPMAAIRTSVAANVLPFVSAGAAGWADSEEDDIRATGDDDTEEMEATEDMDGDAAEEGAAEDGTDAGSGDVTELMLELCTDAMEEAAAECSIVVLPQSMP